MTGSGSGASSQPRVDHSDVVADDGVALLDAEERGESPSVPASESTRRRQLSVTERFESTRKGPRNRPEAANIKDAKVSLRRLGQEALTEWRTLGVASFFLLLSSCCVLAIPHYFGAAMDQCIAVEGTVTAEERRRRFRVIAMELSAFILASGAFGAAQGYFFNSAGSQLVTSLRRRLFESILHQNIGFFDQSRTGELTSRLSSDVTLMRMVLTGDVSSALKATVVILGGVTYLFTLAWRLALVVILVVPPVVVAARYYGRYVRDKQRQVQEMIAAATSEAEEAISNIRTARTFSAEPVHLTAYTNAVEHSLELMKTTALASATFGSGIGTVFGAATLGVLAYGFELVISGEMTSGTLTSFILYMFTITGAIVSVTRLGANLMRVAGATERVFGIIDMQREPNLSSGDDLQGVYDGIALQDVHFSYPSRPEVPVLQGVSLQLKAGTVTALVGPSGGGKSTIASLVTGLYAPSQGNIQLDGHDMSKFSLASLHSKIAAVSQEPVLFCTTIAQNIAYGLDEDSVGDGEITNAAIVANADEFVRGFPEGYDTLVGERGVRLSGGQKQRIAIARAVIRSPQVLVLDEATSALDSESEHLVQEALSRSMQGRTALVIAHRLSTVRDADTVVMIDSGRVTASGTHTELMEGCVAYAKLVEKQMLKPGETRMFKHGEEAKS